MADGSHRILDKKGDKTAKEVVLCRISKNKFIFLRKM